MTAALLAVATPRLAAQPQVFSTTGAVPTTWGWVQRAGAVPAARELSGGVMAYDLARGRVVLFGGQGSTASTTLLNDTWEWDGTVWAQRATASRPSGRQGFALAYDAARRKTVLFGGYDGSSLLN